MALSPSASQASSVPTPWQGMCNPWGQVSSLPTKWCWRNSNINQVPPRASSVIHHLSFQVITHQGGKLKCPWAQQITAVRGRLPSEATSWGPLEHFSCRDKLVSFTASLWPGCSIISHWAEPRERGEFDPVAVLGEGSETNQDHNESLNTFPITVIITLHRWVNWH